MTPKLNNGEYLEYLEKEVNNLLDKGLEIFLEKYKERKDKAYIYIQMWTPDWNDGEECMHSVDWCIGKEILENDYYYNEYGDEKERGIFYGIKEENIYNSEIIEIEERDIYAVIKCLERKYQTNKHCLIILGGEQKIVTIIEDYDCGY